nr:PREDICTED: uncharacterized protein LOC105663685 [Megachile rotundata]
MPTSGYLTPPGCTKASLCIAALHKEIVRQEEVSTKDTELITKFLGRRGGNAYTEKVKEQFGANKKKEDEWPISGRDESWEETQTLQKISGEGEREGVENIYDIIGAARIKPSEPKDCGESQERELVQRRQKRGGGAEDKASPVLEMRGEYRKDKQEQSESQRRLNIISLTKAAGDIGDLSKEITRFVNSSGNLKREVKQRVVELIKENMLRIIKAETTNDAVEGQETSNAPKGREFNKGDTIQEVEAREDDEFCLVARKRKRGESNELRATDSDSSPGE